MGAMLTHLDGTAVSCLDLGVGVAGVFINGGGGGVASRPQVKGPTNQRAAHAGLATKGKNVNLIEIVHSRTSLIDRFPIDKSRCRIHQSDSF